MKNSKFDIGEILEHIDKELDQKTVDLSGGGRMMDDLNSYTIFKSVPQDRRAELVTAAAADNALSRAMGSMCGMAIGDSLGHMFEFLPAQDSPGDVRFDLRTMKFHGASNAFNLQPGQWTDDASMGLCMADSLILSRRLDGSDMRVRFWCWWNRGYNNAFRKDRRRTSSVGLGGNISQSLSAVSRCSNKGNVPPAYEAKTEDAGNGSLMRFTPVALFFHAVDLTEVHHFSRQSSYTTHPGIIAAEACSLLGHLIVRALEQPSGEPKNVKAFLEAHTAEYLEVSGLDKKSGWGYDQMKWLVTSNPPNMTERCWNWKNEFLDIAGTLKARGQTYNGYPVSQGYFGSYSMDGLAMALWSVYHTTSFDNAIEKCINLLGDADSHGSIAGQLAGALYGYNSINKKFLEQLNVWDDHEFALRALLLYQLGFDATQEAKRRR